MLRRFGWRRALLAILLTAFAVRAGAAAGVQWLLDHKLHRQFLVPGDADGYWILARHIARGEDYKIYDPPRYVLRMPGFPAVLAVAMAVCGEDHPLAIRLWLAAIGTLGCGLVFWLGFELADTRTGLWASGLAALSPLFVGFSVLELSETLFAVTILAGLICAARYLNRGVGTALQAAGCGCWVAAATYVRPSWLLAAPLLAAFLVSWSPVRWRAAAHGAVLVAACAACLAPWTYRNFLVTGHVVPTTLWMGASLYDGLNPRATGDSDMTFFETDGLMQNLSEYEVDRHYRRAALEFAWSHPLRAVQLAGVKAMRYWSVWPNAEGFDRWPLKVLCAAWFIPVMACAIAAGFLPAPPTMRPWALWLAWGPILYFAAIHLVFVGSLRYRLPAEYPLLVAAAVGALRWWGMGKAGNEKCKMENAK